MVGHTRQVITDRNEQRARKKRPIPTMRSNRSAPPKDRARVYALLDAPLRPRREGIH